MAASATVELDGLGRCAGVGIYLSGPAGTLVTATTEGGDFSITGTTPGAYNVTVEVEGFESFDEVFVIQPDGDGNVDLGLLKLYPAMLTLSGNVTLADGESPAGTVVEIAAEQTADVPSGLDCQRTTPDLARSITEVATVRSDGRYEVRVARSARNVRGRVERPNYTRARFNVPDNALDSAEAEPVDVGTTTLYPLTGFVNVVGGTLHSQAELELQISAFNGAGEMALGLVSDPGDTACTFGPWRTFSATAVTDLSGRPDGVQTICVRVRNAEQQEIELRTDVSLDQTPPTPPLLMMAGGGVTSTSPAINLQILSSDTASGLDRLELYDNGGAAQTLLYSPVIPYVLNGEGPHTITAIATDRAGNRSLPGTAVISLDSVPPSFAATITNNGRLVTITLTAISDTSEREVRFGYDGPGNADMPLATALWQSIPRASAVTLATILPALDGTYTISVQMRDVAGNVQPLIVDQTLNIDETPPQNPLVLIIDDNGVTRDPVLSLHTDALGASEMRLSTSTTALTSAAWLPFGTTATIDVSSLPDGQVFVYAQFRDAFGNASAIVHDTIVLDRTPPSPITVNVNGGPYVASVSVLLNVDVTDTGPVTMIVSNDPVYNEAPQAFAPNIAHLLAPGDGPRRVYVRFFDLAGNAADLASGWITLDTTPPAMPLIRTSAQVVDADTFTVELYPASATDTNFAAFEVLGGADYVTGFVPVSYSPSTTRFTFALIQDSENLLQIRARDQAGNTSVPGQVIIVEDSTSPAPLTDVRVRNLDGKLTLSWKPSSDAGVVGYQIYYGLVSRFDRTVGPAENPYAGQLADQGASPLWVPGRLSDHFTISGLPNGSQIYATVVPVDHSGKAATFGNEVIGRPNLVTPDHKFPPARYLNVRDDTDLKLDLRPGIVRRGGYMYVAADNRIEVLDLSDPLLPAKVSQATVGIPDARLTTLVMHPTLARLYAVELDPGATDTGLVPRIAVFDVSTAGAVSYLGSVSAGTSRLPVDMVATGQRLYFSAVDAANLFGGTHELAAMSLTDPDAPEPDQAASLLTDSILLEMEIDGSGQHLYVGNFFTGIDKYDISSGAPLFVTRSALGVHGGLGDFVVYGDFLYAAQNPRRLQLFDLRNGSIEPTGYEFAVTEFNGFWYQEVFMFGDGSQESGGSLLLDGSTLFAVGSEGVGAFDLAVTNNITVIGKLVDLSGPYDFVNLTAVTTPVPIVYGFDRYELTAFDLSNERVHSRQPIRHAYKGLDVLYGLIAVAEGTDGIAIYDYNGGAAVELTRVTYASCNFERVQWVQQEGRRMIYAYSAQPAGFVSIDASNPYQPTLRSELYGCPSTPATEWMNFANAAGPFAVSDAAIFWPWWTADATDIRLYKLAMDGTGAPDDLDAGFCQISAGDVDIPIRNVVLHGDRILVAHGTVGVEVYTTANAFAGGSCTRLGELYGSLDDALLTGDELITRTGNRLDRYSIVDPTNWIPQGTSIELAASDHVRGLTYAGGLILVLTENGLQIYDDNNAAGRLVGVGADPFGNANFREGVDLAVERNWAIGLTRDRGIQLWQLATPSRLDLLGGPLLDQNSSNAFAIRGGLLATGGYFPGPPVSYDIQVYDARGMASFTPISSITLNWGDRVKDMFWVPGLSGGHQAFVAVTESSDFSHLGVYRVSVTVPSQPQYTFAFTQGTANDTVVDGDRLYTVTDVNNGIIAVFDLSGARGIRPLKSISLGYRIRELLVQGGIAAVHEDGGFSDPLHLYRVADDAWTWIDTLSPVLLGDPVIQGRYLFVAASDSGFNTVDLRTYDLRDVFAGTGPLQLVGVAQGKSISAGAQLAGSDILDRWGTWMSYTSPNTVSTQFADTDVYFNEIQVDGPYLFATDLVLGGLVRYAVE